MDINWLLVVVLSLFFVSILNGYRKGFLRIVISFISTLLVILAVIVIAPKLGEYIINNTDYYEITRQKVIRTFEDRLNNNIEDENDKLESLNIPSILKDDFISKNASELYQEIVGILFKDYISGYLAQIIIKAGAFVGLFVSLSIIRMLLIKTTSLVSKIPIIGGINSILGAIVGFMWALIIVWIVFFVIIMFMNESIGTHLLEDIQNSNILTYLFDSNFLFRFIS